jgi:hypothetical protein
VPHGPGLVVPSPHRLRDASLANTHRKRFPMNRATAQMRMIAERLIEYETQAKDSAVAGGGAHFQVTERLRPHLATLMGNGGFRALLARAHVLACVEVSWLRTVKVSAEGTLDGLETPHARLTPAQFREGRIILLAQLLGLLVAFIGPGLTSRLVGEIWPQLAAENVDFGNGGKK